jgi:hypothetical protein
MTASAQSLAFEASQLAQQGDDSGADALFERCGFEVKRRSTLGIVDFVLLE